MLFFYLICFESVQFFAFVLATKIKSNSSRMKNTKVVNDQRGMFDHEPSTYNHDQPQVRPQ